MSVQNGSVLPEKVCVECGFRGARGVLRRCPRCTGPLRTEAELRQCRSAGDEDADDDAA